MTIDKWGYKPQAPKRKTIYIAGPMTGLPDLNFPAFHAEAARLRDLGWDVVNPAEINPDKHLSRQQCMRTDIAALVFCDAIQLLPGWEHSEGATLEHHIAERLGLTIYAPAVEIPVEQTTNCNRHPAAPHGPDGNGRCLCASWAMGDAS